MRVTPPFKPYLEEKLWFALFWLRPLREFWRRELSERHFLELQKHIPYTWILDPAPLPQHAVIPELEDSRWRKLKPFRQKQRDLILKISGFSEIGWGSRSVTLGSDASQAEWQAAIEHALADFPHHPYDPPALPQRPARRAAVSRPRPARSRRCAAACGCARIISSSTAKPHLRGALATICPADKKLLHGMKDAIMVPTAVS